MAGSWAHFGSPVEHNPLHAFSNSPGQGTLSPVSSNSLPGLASILPSHLSSSPKIAPIGKDQGRTSHASDILVNSGSMLGAAYQPSLTFNEQKLNAGSGPMSAFAESNSKSSGIGTLSGPQFLWGSPTPYNERASSAWPTSSVGHSFSSGRQGFPYSSRQGSFLGTHHVGSAPSGIPLDRRFGYFPESPDTSFMSPVGFGGMSLNRNNGSYMMNIGHHAAISSGISLPGNVAENGSPSFRMMSVPRHGTMFPANGSYPGPGTSSNEGFMERGRTRRVENSSNQIDSKKQYQLDLEKIISGEDTRTTLMIKNIPNKYE